MRTHGEAVWICVLWACHRGARMSGARIRSAAPDPSHASSAAASLIKCSLPVTVPHPLNDCMIQKAGQVYGHTLHCRLGINLKE
jgi:hypothetical protein